MLASSQRLFRRAAWTCGLVIPLVLAVGCNDRSPTIDRVGVSGTVTLDGQPLPAGAIVFKCEPKNPGGDAITAFGFVENGRYQIEAENGPTAGLARVQFRPKPLPRGEMEDAIDQSAGSSRRRDPNTTLVAIPEKYGDASTLIVELTAGQNQHNFSLDSRK